MTKLIERHPRTLAALIVTIIFTTITFAVKSDISDHEQVVWSKTDDAIGAWVAGEDWQCARSWVQIARNGHAFCREAQTNVLLEDGDSKVSPYYHVKVALLTPRGEVQELLYAINVEDRSVSPIYVLEPQLLAATGDDHPETTE